MSLLSHLHSSTQIINQFLPNLALLCSTIRPNGQTYRLACLLVKPDTAISQAAPPGNLGHPLKPVTTSHNYKPKTPNPSALNAWVVGQQKRPANRKKKNSCGAAPIGAWDEGIHPSHAARKHAARKDARQDADSANGAWPHYITFLETHDATVMHFFVFFFSQTHISEYLNSSLTEGRPEQAFQDDSPMRKPLPVKELGAYARSSFLYMYLILCIIHDYWK